MKHIFHVLFTAYIKSYTIYMYDIVYHFSFTLSNTHVATFIIYVKKGFFSIFSSLSKSILLLIRQVTFSLPFSFSSFLACLFSSSVNPLSYSCKTPLNSKVTAELITGFRGRHTPSLAPLLFHSRSLTLARSLLFTHTQINVHLCYLIWNLLHWNPKNIIALIKMNEWHMLVQWLVHLEKPMQKQCVVWTSFFELISIQIEKLFHIVFTCRQKIAFAIYHVLCLRHLSQYICFSLL